MKQYNKYLIGDTDRFDENVFSSLPGEIYDINEKTNHIPPAFKVEMIISFLKDHSLNDNWIKANPRLAELVTSNTIFSGCIEGLFQSSQHNAAFQHDLENYLKEKLAEPHPVAPGN